MKAAIRSLAFLVGAMIFLPGASFAQTTGTLFRSYLSAKGVDTNPCTVDAPCRLLPAALAATQSGGEVWIVDSANYNTSAVQITQSVTILAVPGALGSLVTNAGDAIDIIGQSITVTLRNLVIRNFNNNQGFGVTLTGTGSQLIVESSEFSGHHTAVVVNTGGAYLSVSNSIFRTNVAAIVFSGISASNVSTGIIDQCTIVGPGTAASPGAIGAVFTNANVTINNTKVSNTRTGISIGSNAAALLNNNVVANNYFGISLGGNSSIGYSSSNNSLDNVINVTNGSLQSNPRY